MYCVHCILEAYQKEAICSLEGEAYTSEPKSLHVLGENITVRVGDRDLPMRAVTTVEGTALCAEHAVAISEIRA